MAYMLANQCWAPGGDFILLILSSYSLYLGGMVLNDVFDVAVDLVERPNRPIPAGQISKRSASLVGFGLLAAGVIFAFLAGWLGNSGAELGWNSPLVRSVSIALALAFCIYLYDGPLKRTIVAPVIMGLCRFLNVLLGASTFIPLAVNLDAASNSQWLGMPQVVVWVACSIGVLVAGVTLLGRREASTKQSRLALAVGGIGILAGLAGIASTVWGNTEFQIAEKTKQMFPLFIGLASLTIVRRVVEAVFVASPNKIQAAVISVLRSLIIFDAMLCYLAAPQNLVYALAVLALLIPSILLSKVISTT